MPGWLCGDALHVFVDVPHELWHLDVTRVRMLQPLVLLQPFPKLPLKLLPSPSFSAALKWLQVPE